MPLCHAIFGHYLPRHGELANTARSAPHFTAFVVSTCNAVAKFCTCRTLKRTYGPKIAILRNA
ncbi:hypothetical protein SAMN04488144_12382 [Methylobacterium sp. 190mf]|nr:hypothetical protein SAMN04488144_12382 [Methylobacterium sp. 190mf]SEI07480.1 hypothetical protein SAMN02799636_05329 [Methylobacterium sp. 275MFSha3.1]